MVKSSGVESLQARGAVASLARAAVFCGAGWLCGAGVAQVPMEFTCSAKHAAKVDELSAKSLYDAAKEDTATMGSYGFDLMTRPESVAGGACSSATPFFFSVAVPDGNYRVTLALGGEKSSTTTVKAESRRLMVMERAVKAGGSETVSFVVNVRTPPIAARVDGAAPEVAPGDMTGPAAARSKEPPTQVRLKSREIGALDWDNKLTLEFNGENPSVRSITVAPDPDVPTLYIAGDSTVVDQDKEPWAAWGQMLPMFFKPDVAVANAAESGETIRSFVGENRLAKVMSTIKAGDYLMIQFAHNDQKLGNGYVPAETDYKNYLRRYIADARMHHATPILVTSMNRRAFDADGHIMQTLGDYPEAMRQVAAEEHVALIDLNAMSKTLFEAMGEQGTLKAFVHYPANTFPDQPQELKDNTHFNAYGAYELARCIVQSIEVQHLPLARFLRAGIEPFNPAKPTPLTSWYLPPSPTVSAETPYGR